MDLKERIIQQSTHISEVKQTLKETLQSKGLILSDNPTFQEINEKINGIEVFEWDLENPLISLYVYTNDDATKAIFKTYETEVSPYGTFRVLTTRASINSAYANVTVSGNLSFLGKTYQHVYMYGKGSYSSMKDAEPKETIPYRGRFKFTPSGSIIAKVAGLYNDGKYYGNGVEISYDNYRVDMYIAIPK